MRPGAGYLPTLALGRPRGRTTEPACTDRGVARAGLKAGALRMTLSRSAPRQAYRIYSEEEFLAAEDWQVEPEPEFALLGRVGQQRRPTQWGRLATLAALTSVVGAVVGVVALHATRSRPESDRRFADGGIALPPTRAGSPQEIVADRSSVRPLDARSRKHTRRAYVSVRRLAERRPRPVGRSPIPAHPYLPPQPPPPVQTPVPVLASAVKVSAKATVRTATTATAAAGGARSEFGFERR